MPSTDAGGLTQLTAAELEFIAEDQLIEIVPKFKHGPLHLIQGDFGPFVPQARAKVPLWLAITLKKRQKCVFAFAGVRVCAVASCSNAVGVGDCVDSVVRK